MGTSNKDNPDSKASRAGVRFRCFFKHHSVHQRSRLIVHLPHAGLQRVHLEQMGWRFQDSHTCPTETLNHGEETLMCLTHRAEVFAPFAPFRPAPACSSSGSRSSSRARTWERPRPRAESRARRLPIVAWRWTCLVEEHEAEALQVLHLPRHATAMRYASAASMSALLPQLVEAFVLHLQKVKSTQARGVSSGTASKCFQLRGGSIPQRGPPCLRATPTPRSLLSTSLNFPPLWCSLQAMPSSSAPSP